MDLTAALVQAGGIATYRELRPCATRAEIDSALAEERIARANRGTYTLPDFDRHLRAAASLAGVLSGLSAATFWGWKTKFPAERPQVPVPLGRKVASRRRCGVDLRWGAVSPEDLRRRAIGRTATVIDCAKRLPFDAALAVVDSALRDGMSKTNLLLACQRSPQKLRRRALTVIELGDARADNPFESVLRAILLEVPGAHFEPQVWVGNVGRADLVDRERRIVVEADSFEFHSSAEAMLRDMERYNGFLAEGYRVLRFGWKHAMFQPDYVHAAVASVVAAQGRQIVGA
ncbi:MAG: DUF559 domain-containing protein [Marmoricola sp.]